MRVVFDANVVLAGVCWQGEGWLCLIRLAQRRAFAYGTAATLEETRETVPSVPKPARTGIGDAWDGSFRVHSARTAVVPGQVAAMGLACAR